MKTINSLKKSLFVVSIFFCSLNVYALSSWQGEWGVWQRDPGKEDSSSYNTGANVSIYDCNESSCSFAFNVGNVLRQKGEIKRYYHCDWKGKFHVISPLLAEGITTDFYNHETNCKFTFSMNNDSSIRVIKREGNACNYQCASDMPDGVLPYPETYHLKTHDSYKIKGYKYYNQVCYADSSAARQLWCKDLQLQEMDKKLLKFTFKLTNHTKKYPSEDISLWLKNVLQQCETSKDIQSCLLQAYTQKITSFKQIEKERESEDALARKNLLLPGDPTQASKIIDNIQGVYKFKVKGSLYDGSGETYVAEDILEIVRVAKDVIYFKTSLSFDNGHTGGVFGIAQYKKEGLFLYSDNEGINGECLLKIIPTAKEIKFKTNGACSHHYGARGTLDGIAFTYKQRRPIRYLKLLVNSEDYKNSIRELSTHK